MPKNNFLLENLTKGVRFFRILTKSAKNVILAFRAAKNAISAHPKNRFFERPRGAQFSPTDLFCR